jgi:origin recognition complex subunit 5
VVVNCKECVTGRHLLERTIAAVDESLQDGAVNGRRGKCNGRCENLSALAGHLHRLLRGGEKYILAFDGIDRQREAPHTLLPALARLGEVV